MICSTVDDKVIIKTATGDKFAIPTIGVFVDVPTRDGTGNTMRRWFNMKELLLKNRVDPRTTADEASGALRICHEWLDCPEKSLAIRTIKQFLDSKREERRDETLLIMAMRISMLLSSEQQRVRAQSVRDVRWQQVRVLDAERFTDHEACRRSYQGSVRDCEVP